MSPILAFAEEQPFADDRTQDSNGRRCPPVVRDMVDQHMMDRVGSIEEEAFAAEKGLFQDVFGIGLARPDLERVGAQRDKQPVRP